MTPSARLAAAIEALGAISAEAAPPADRVLDRYFRDRRYIGSKDRQAIAERVFGVLRRRARLDWHLRESGYRDVVDARRRVLADVMVADGRSMDAIEMLFSAGPHATGALSDREVALAERLAGRPLDAPDAPPECPFWLAERLRALFGERFAEEMSALNRTAPFDLRANLLRAKDRDEAQAALKAEGIEAEPTTLSPLGLRLGARKPIEHWTAFRSGMVEVQDEGSQIVAALVDAKPGMKVVDYCAGAGGKTLALAASMKNEGRIVACDTSEGGSTARRCGCVAPVSTMSRRICWRPATNGPSARPAASSACWSTRLAADRAPGGATPMRAGATGRTTSKRWYRSSARSWIAPRGW